MTDLGLGVCCGLFARVLRFAARLALSLPQNLMTRLGLNLRFVESVRLVEAKIKEAVAPPSLFNQKNLKIKKI